MPLFNGCNITVEELEAQGFTRKFKDARCVLHNNIDFHVEHDGEGGVNIEIHPEGRESERQLRHFEGGDPQFLDDLVYNFERMVRAVRREIYNAEV